MTQWEIGWSFVNVKIVLITDELYNLHSFLFPCNTLLLATQPSFENKDPSSLFHEESFPPLLIFAPRAAKSFSGRSETWSVLSAAADVTWRAIWTPIRATRCYHGRKSLWLERTAGEKRVPFLIVLIFFGLRNKDRMLRTCSCVRRLLVLNKMIFQLMET